MPNDFLTVTITTQLRAGRSGGAREELVYLGLNTELFHSEVLPLKQCEAKSLYVEVELQIRGREGQHRKNF